MAAHEDYQLDGRQLAYLDWLLLPKSERPAHLSSEEKYAASIGVDDSTTRKWKRHPQFRKEWQERAMRLQGSPERTQDLLDTLYRKGQDGDVRAAELWGRWTGQLKAETQKVEVTTSAKDLSDEELKSLLAKVTSDELAARRTKSEGKLANG